MNPSLTRVRVLSGVLVVTAVAGILVFASMRLAGGEPLDTATPTTEVVQLPSDAPRPSLPADLFQPVTPPYVNIEGKQVPLPAGLGYALNAAIPGRPDWPAMYWLVKYDPSPLEPGESWLATDTNGFILGMEIRPEDEALFQPFLDAASTKPTPTPRPLVKIGGREVLLPPGLEYHQIIWSNTQPGPNDLAWVVTYSDGQAVSRLYIDDGAGSTLLKADIRPEHLSLFAPLLADVAD